MKKRVLKSTLSVALSVAVAASTLSSLGVVAFGDDVTIPAPVAVYDFSNSFEELAEKYPGFEVLENEAAPTLVQDEEMGQVLQLGKAVIEEQNVGEGGYIYSDNSQYSTINIANPYKGKEELKEYEPYEDVQTASFRNCMQPNWEKGITISYWIKTPTGKTDGLGINSNVVGFTSERFLMQADDYAKYLCTVKFDVDNAKWTDEQKELLGITYCGVDNESDFWFTYAQSEPYLGAPLYGNPSDRKQMGRIYWFNKNFVDGHVQKGDGTIESTLSNSGRYAQYCEAPYLGATEDDHNPGESIIRYKWAYSEMWLDASSSFFYECDNSKSNRQLNPNHGTSYDTLIGAMNGDVFSINSWKSAATIEEAVNNSTAADSPCTIPDEWHNVTCVIQNDWVMYYLDGEEVAIEDNYSSYGGTGLATAIGGMKPWKRFNKGTGSRYGYGTDKTSTYWCYYGNYVAPTIMEWIYLDCVDVTIGGGNRAGDGYNMFADTDEIKIKNIVFYDELLDEDQIEALAEDARIYEDGPSVTIGDVVGDNNGITPDDALAVLKHVALIETLSGDAAEAADTDCDGSINPTDALYILQYVAGLISSFDEVKAE